VLFFGLFLLFLGLFFRCPLPLEEANSAIFRYFLLIFGLFSVGLPSHPLENFLPTPLPPEDIVSGLIKLATWKLIFAIFESSRKQPHV